MAYQVDLRRVDLHALFDIRGDEEGMQALLESQNMPMPSSRDQWTRAGDRSVLRAGPARCLFLAPLEHEETLESALRSASELSYVNATRISDMYTALTVDGNDVLSVLSQVTPLDVESMVVGTATATDLFATAGFIFRHDEQRFSLYFESSYFDYACERLQKCANFV